MSTTIPQTDALDLARNNYQEYSLYIASGRSYPCLIDGAKSVQKRIIYSLVKKAPRSIVKVAEAAGYCLDMHPHPSAVPEVIVSLGDNGNKFNFLDKQGNFGNKSKDIIASAPRYIGCRLSDLAIDLTCDGVEYCPTITGELDKPEPVALPTLLPLCFLNGSQGIPAGLPKLNIPCLDIPGMFDYYLEVLKNKDLNYTPKKVPIPNVGVPILSSKAEWEAVLKNGKGTIRLAPEMSIDKNGTILTSAHVVEDCENVIVTMSNGQDYKAKLLKTYGKNKDIALLKIDTVTELKTVKFGDSEKIKVGQKVLTIGNPFGFNGTLTQGIISRIDYAKNRIQTDAAINPGCSGGPLLNKKGEIIGINQAIYNPDNNISNIGIGFAIPINLVKQYLADKSDI